MFFILIIYSFIYLIHHIQSLSKTTNFIIDFIKSHLTSCCQSDSINYSISAFTTLSWSVWCTCFHTWPTTFYSLHNSLLARWSEKQFSRLSLVCCISLSFLQIWLFSGITYQLLHTKLQLDNCIAAYFQSWLYFSDKEFQHLVMMSRYLSDAFKHWFKLLMPG